MFLILSRPPPDLEELLAPISDGEKPVEAVNSKANICQTQACADRQARLMILLQLMRQRDFNF